MKKICDNILEAIGDTPLVRINRLTRGVIQADVLAKVETFNPGNSIKDRMAVRMIEDAERSGALEARRHDHRGHLRQHRHGPGDRRRDQGLQVHLHHHRQAVEGEGRRAQGVRRRRHRLPDQRRAGRPALVLLRVVAPGQGSAQLAGRPTSTTTCRTRPRTTSRPAPRSGSRPAGASTTWSSASAPAARSAASAGSSRRRTRGSRCGASTPTARCSRSTRRPGSSTRTRSTPTSPKASARTSCPITSTSGSSTTSRR